MRIQFHCMDPSKNSPPAQAILFWIVWFAILSGLVVMQVFLGGGVPTGRNAPDAPMPVIVWVCVAEVMAAALIRWLVLPRFAELPRKFVWMVVGLALAEGAGILGMFLLPRDQPETRLVIFLLSFFGVLQFVPLYARAPPR
jgi:hypothetical protein